MLASEKKLKWLEELITHLVSFCNRVEQLQHPILGNPWPEYIWRDEIRALFKPAQFSIGPLKRSSRISGDREP